ncbi:MAG: uncharacterized protein A8A55_3129, partial [Amphiamblys sp. WSBS2006]
AVPKDIAELSILKQDEKSFEYRFRRENIVDYYRYKKGKEHGSHFDNLLIVDDTLEHGDKKNPPRIKNFPTERKEAVLLLSFLAEKELVLELGEIQDTHPEEENKWGLELPYGVNLFVNEESSCYLELFDLTNTRIKKLCVSSFDIAEVNLKNTHIEELFLVDEAAMEFFYNSMEKTTLKVDQFSFGFESYREDKTISRTLRWIYEQKKPTPRKIKCLSLKKDNLFGLLEEAKRINQREIHVEELSIKNYKRLTEAQKKVAAQPETKIFVNKRLELRGNVFVLLYIELSPELKHLKIDGMKENKRRYFNDDDTYMVLTKSKTIIKNFWYPINTLKRNITATELVFFSYNFSGRRTGITLAKEMESICLEGSMVFLSHIANDKIDVRRMEIADILGRPSYPEEDEEMMLKRKEFVIRERLYMRNAGIFFMLFLAKATFIPTIEIEMSSRMCFFANG